MKTNYPTVPIDAAEIDTLFAELERVYAIVWYSVERVRLPSGTYLLAGVLRGTLPRVVKTASPLYVVEEIPARGGIDMTNVLYRVLWRAVDWCTEHALTSAPE